MRAVPGSGVSGFTRPVAASSRLADRYLDERRSSFDAEPFGRKPLVIDLAQSELHDAVDRRDPAFDGVFFVAITSTRIYCRPVCPSRRARPENRRFFFSRVAAEECGYRPCRRCRPELAPGQATVDAVPRLAHRAAEAIASGALNGRTVRELALELGMSERHMRRALERETGASPSHLALSQRLATAARLLVETRTPITQVAFASGFQSVRRFNSAFRERFAMTPRQWRKQGCSTP
jgi:AraC family transcriptional regulator of adaptative response / DNA-3-methyladenine glycosylase II